LLWWFNTESLKHSIPDFEYENINCLDNNYSGLDINKIDKKNPIKSAWRHIKTRYYFTSASHLYSLINTILYGIDSYLLDHTDANKKMLKLINEIDDLDYLSHIMFRLYERFNIALVNNLILILI